ncbi:hypothetical protein ANN_03585 [Periplaneta americana]|uniref:Uncharacterized protein n=1 Tax=Periplaneta americana TaxID=6978 RepID=A0ABQ8TZ92_PERAM|nr:hypothetical protein ANN_03585 [Periplaneta americana]
MVGLCEGGNEPPDFLKAVKKSGQHRITSIIPHFDYCDVLFSDLWIDSAQKLQRVDNACSTDLDLSTALTYQLPAACFKTETPDASRSRMSIKSFDDLLNLISHKIRKTDTVMRKSIHPVENLLVTLREGFVITSALKKKLKVRIYKTVILPVVLCGCETWTLTLREEQRLKVFEKKVLRKVLGDKRDEATEEWRKLHNTELHDALYSSPDIIRNINLRRLRWAGHVACIVEMNKTNCRSRLLCSLHLSFESRLVIRVLLIILEIAFGQRGKIS